MPASATQLIDVRRWGVPSTYTDAQIDAALDRRGTVEAAALELIELILADYGPGGTPITFAVTGDYSETWSPEQIRALESKAEALRQKLGTTDALARSVSAGNVQGCVRRVDRRRLFGED